MRVAICVAVIQNGRILLVRKRKTWILPGGKPESGESNLQCLVREVREELPGINLKNLQFYKSFEGRTPHQGDILKAKVYFADIEDKTEAKLKTGAEINAMKWTQNPERCSLSEITEKIVNSLYQDNYL